MEDPIALLHAAKAVFDQQYQHLPEEARRQKWSLMSSAVGTDVPRSMPMSPWSSTPNSNSISHALQMNRSTGLSVQSAPDMLSRDFKTSQHHERQRSSNYEHHSSSLMTGWQNGMESSYTDQPPSTSSAVKKRRRYPSLPKVVEGVLHDVPDYLAATKHVSNLRPTYSPSYPLVTPPYQDPSRLSVSDVSSQYTWGSPTDSSVASTPLTELSATNMSRNGSLQSDFSLANHSLPTALDMMRVHSDVSDFSMSSSHAEEVLKSITSFNSQDISRSQSFANATPYLSHSSHPSLAFPPFDAVNSTSSSQAPSCHVATFMQRSDSDQSVSSTSSNQCLSRSTQRHREQLVQQKNCHIAPKASKAVKVETHKMARVKSKDGTWKQVGVLPRKQQQIYQRPQHPKQYCLACDDHPDGFRGDHELQRHVNRAHSKTRKVWVCVDSSPDQKYLSNCKACRTQKRYGAYYNAAAHLRRAHFNPRKRGRKAKTEAEKRGGKGGGNWPPIEILKEKWMKEIEEDGTDESQPTPSETAVDADEDKQYSADLDSNDHAAVNTFTPNNFGRTTVDNLLDDSFNGSYIETDTSFMGFDLSCTQNLMSQATGVSNYYPQMGYDNTLQFEDSFQQQSTSGY
ncbi:hypothetical protein EJ08DRAFT_285951 [Tothia fuscella]|uniref:DUF7896 domain-containing protein n=1 Tax=Tothia fuscella TaxID=1048955 RepID=A0A9P4U451_9PEZI|nr:hypothetical protein EJ08DRAFT_285951 [Tothia fuscella]